MITIDLSAAWQIALPHDHPTARLAARELSDILFRISGQKLTITASPSAGVPYFSLGFDGLEGESFHWLAGESQVDFHGQGPRGLLYAVYDFLEALGCCWFAPGDEGAHIPEGKVFELAEKRERSGPALPGRCLVIGHHAFMQDAADWAIWAARNRLNTIFIHTIDGPMAVGAVAESQYQRMKAIFLPLMQERGMVLEHGGHGLTDKLPRSLFARMPEAFRFSGGKRTPDHNFCPTSREGLAVICRNAEKHFRAHPEVDVFHLWGDDIDGGGWCGCERCAPYNASEQLLLATNALAETLEAVNPEAQISFIAYHDTEAVPAGVKPRHNVHVLWAPRKRCYAHAVDDETCRLNVPQYAQTLRRQVAYFQSHAAAPARVFEYYLDAILFKSVLPPLPTTMQADMRFYRDACVHTVQALMTGDYAWTTPQINAWLFARLAWEPDQGLEQLLSQFSQAAFGADLSPYYRSLEAAFSLALDIAPEQVRLEVSRADSTIWDRPPADMGDPYFAPQEVLEEKCRQNNAILDWIEQAREGLDAAAGQASPALRSEKRHFALLERWLRFDLARLHLYSAMASGAAAQIKANWLAARSALRGVYLWGRKNIRARKHRINFRFLQYYTWQIRLNKIRAEHLSGYPGKVWLKYWTLFQLKRHYKKMRFLYEED